MIFTWLCSFFCVLYILFFLCFLFFPFFVFLFFPSFSVFFWLQNSANRKFLNYTSFDNIFTQLVCFQVHKWRSSLIHKSNHSKALPIYPGLRHLLKVISPVACDLFVEKGKNETQHTDCCAYHGRTSNNQLRCTVASSFNCRGTTESRPSEGACAARAVNECTSVKFTSWRRISAWNTKNEVSWPFCLYLMWTSMAQNFLNFTFNEDLFLALFNVRDGYARLCPSLSWISKMHR